MNKQKALHLFLPWDYTSCHLWTRCHSVHKNVFFLVTEKQMFISLISELPVTFSSAYFITVVVKCTPVIKYKVKKLVTECVVLSMYLEDKPFMSIISSKDFFLTQKSFCPQAQRAAQTKNKLNLKFDRSLEFQFSLSAPGLFLNVTTNKNLPRLKKKVLSPLR